MKITLKDAADFVGGKIIGNSDLEITNLARIEDAKPTELSFLYRKTFLKYLETTKASALIVSPDIPTDREDLSYIVVEDANGALQKIISTFIKPGYSLEGIADSSVISDSSELGANCSVGENVVIEKKCKIGKGTNIYHNTVIMNNVTIGDDCTIFPNVTIRENCVIGNNVIIHPGVVIGADGFGYTPDGKGNYDKIPQVGNVIIEDDVEIGANTCIDRAALGSTLIKRGAKIDNLVQIAHNVEIGSATAISAQTGISGSSKVGNHVILAGQVGLVDHIEIEDGTIVGAQAGVSKSIKKGRYFGYPAKEIGHFSKLEAHMRNLPKYAEKIKSLEKTVKELEERLNK